MGKSVDVTFSILKSRIKTQIDNLIDSENLQRDIYREIFARSWIDREAVFDRYLEQYGMNTIKKIPNKGTLGFILLTYSGSLITVGPLINGKRSGLYFNTGLRKLVPQKIVIENCLWEGEIKADQPVYFLDGPVKQSSPIYRMAVLKDSGSVVTADAEKKIFTAAEKITREWELTGRK